jgi:ribosomal protein S18 acetylase RimI-like enzyme
VPDLVSLRAGDPGDADALARVDLAPSPVTSSGTGDFFSRAFVWLIAVDPARRRTGIASMLVHAFIARHGSVRRGEVDNLDPGDPEVFHFKPGLSHAHPSTSSG